MKTSWWFDFQSKKSLLPLQSTKDADNSHAILYLALNQLLLLNWNIRYPKINESEGTYYKVTAFHRYIVNKSRPREMKDGLLLVSRLLTQAEYGINHFMREIQKVFSKVLVFSLKDSLTDCTVFRHRRSKVLHRILKLD